MRIGFRAASGLLLLILMAIVACGTSSESDSQSLETELDESLNTTETLVDDSNADDSEIPSEDALKPDGEVINDAQLPKPLAEATPRQPLQLVDDGATSAEFTQFRENLRQAVQNRDAEFIRAIAAPDIKLSFGLPMTIDELDIDNPSALFWQNMEKAIATGCVSEIFGVEPEKQTWICPHAFLAPDQVSSMDPFEHIVIVGNDINVRVEPTVDSPVVGSVSNEVVRYDSEGTTELSERQLEAMSTVDGWHPIIMASGQRGFVSSRYAYSPIGYRAFFVKDNDAWQMTIFIAGD